MFLSENTSHSNSFNTVNDETDALFAVSELDMDYMTESFNLKTAFMRFEHNLIVEHGSDMVMYTEGAKEFFAKLKDKAIVYFQKLMVVLMFASDKLAEWFAKDATKVVESLKGKNAKSDVTNIEIKSNFNLAELTSVDDFVKAFNILKTELFMGVVGTGIPIKTTEYTKESFNELKTKITKISDSLEPALKYGSKSTSYKMTEAHKTGYEPRNFSKISALAAKDPNSEKIIETFKKDIFEAADNAAKGDSKFGYSDAQLRVNALQYGASMLVRVMLKLKGLIRSFTKVTLNIMTKIYSDDAAPPKTSETANVSLLSAFM